MASEILNRDFSGAATWQSLSERSGKVVKPTVLYS